MKVIVISPSQKLDSEIGILINMFEQGLPIYHLRKKKFSTHQLKHFLNEIPNKYHNRIVIHTHHDLVRHYKLKGIYISQSHKKKKIKLWILTQWLKLKRRYIEISTTLRNMEGVLDYNSQYNYIFLAPVFDSPLGNFQSAFTEYNLASILGNTKYKVVARGGVSLDTIEKAHLLGFDGIAFYTSIWKANSPLQEFIKIKEKFKELSLPME